MIFFDKYFKPYAEYCIRTIFSEEELKAAFAAELPSRDNMAAAFKAMFNVKSVTFFRTNQELVLAPYLYDRNSLRGTINIKCQPDKYSTATILHITIVPENIKPFLWFFSVFYLFWSAAVLCAGSRLIFLISLLMPLFMFMVLGICRAAAESEVPKIRQEFEKTLRRLEQKYQSEISPPA